MALSSSSSATTLKDNMYLVGKKWFVTFQLKVKWYLEFVESSKLKISDDGFRELEGGREPAEVSGPDFSVSEDLLDGVLNLGGILKLESNCNSMLSSYSGKLMYLE